MRSTADDAKLAAAVKADDGFFATFFVASYSPKLVRLAARLGLRPNQVTVASLAVGLGAAAGFAVGSRPGLILGAVLLQISFTLDVVDGQLARYSGATSEFGAWFDGMVDRTKEYAGYAGLAIGSSRGFHHDVWALAGAALVIQATRHYIDFSYAAGRAATHRGADRHVGYWIRRVVVLPIGERLLLISITAALFRPEVTLVALVSWGGLATGYTLAGRMRRALSDPSPPDAAAALAAYRDDGVATRRGSNVPGWLGPPLVRILAAAIPWFVALGLIGRHTDRRWLIGLALAWLLAWAIIGTVGVGTVGVGTVGVGTVGVGTVGVGTVGVGTVGAGTPLRGRYDFLVPPILLVAETVGILRLSAIASDHDLAAGFAIAVVAVMRRYDLVYRDETGLSRRTVDLLPAGWEVRLVAAYVLAAAGVISTGGYGLAAALAVLLVIPQMSAWQDRGSHRTTPAGAAAEEIS